jgi:flagellar biosynthesis/type III secretory pathway protein FliH
MKPLSIADYLDHLGRASAEKAPPRRESSPFRPRSLPSVENGEPRPKTAFDRTAKTSAGEVRQEDAPRRSPWERKPVAVDFAAPQLQQSREAAKAEDIVARLAEAHARGREEGLTEGRADASDRHAAELAAVQREAEMQRMEFQRNEHAQLEGAIRSGFRQIEDNVGAAVTRILAPFLDKQVVKHVADELRKAIARLCADGSSEVTIRGPERVLSLLRERIADLPAEVRYVEGNGAEVLVEVNATRIVTELRSWAELLASLDA